MVQCDDKQSLMRFMQPAKWNNFIMDRFFAVRKFTSFTFVYNKSSVGAHNFHVLWKSQIFSKILLIVIGPYPFQVLICMTEETFW
jgi:hypothetical protein